MDRLKYRVWDKENEIWLENGDCSLSMDGELTVLGIDAYGETMFCDSKNYLIEQCTGLKDKNGKLIYEGDIVKACLVEGYVNYIVKWGDGNWGLFFGNGQYDICLCERASKEVEIIGNIHENADLLGEE